MEAGIGVEDIDNSQLQEASTATTSTSRRGLASLYKKSPKIAVLLAIPGHGSDVVLNEEGLHCAVSMYCMYLRT
ncbi:hypothetical protein L917_03563 [Phytophthora nicotianae]|uniref:Uncharacterized protein n=1 Tax=Phytophthora nicotianae TaxID=4792 RepID=W2HCP8_PHYNI|nr:hypothetical protein L915_03704 [Phytophthora nicotianae]ETL46469.1 hypothetical protein L916_03640 [Phytophthora nicotianae]ETL99602.1 hypothetical protein L917_03563 [Phytophthora nicotianae]ETM52756.1 hypothetical protein L914_03668 [Phytophthora nicotianae]